MSKDCDHTEQGARQAFLEKLYEEDGRNDPSHQMHSLYTGLMQSHLAKQNQTESN